MTGSSLGSDYQKIGDFGATSNQPARVRDGCGGVGYLLADKILRGGRFARPLGEWAIIDWKPVHYLSSHPEEAPSRRLEGLASRRADRQA